MPALTSAWVFFFVICASSAHPSPLHDLEPKEGNRARRPVKSVFHSQTSRAQIHKWTLPFSLFSWGHDKVLRTPAGERPSGNGKWKSRRRTQELQVASKCHVSFNTGTLTFASCLQLSSDSRFQLAWTADRATGVATVLFQGTPDEFSGWAGWGISPSGSMSGSDVIVGFMGADSATARLYSLQGYYSPSPLSVNSSTTYINLVPGSLQVDIVPSLESLSIQILAKYSGLLNLGKAYVIWKGGPSVDINTAVLDKHTSNAPSSVAVDFSTGIAEEEESSSLAVPHAWLVGIGFGLLLPLGVLIARHAKLLLGSHWFTVHWAAQAAGYALGFCGFWIGISMSLDHGDMSQAPYDHRRHYDVGIAVFTFATVQIITPLLRPHQDAPKRPYWNAMHWTLGYIVIVLAAINIFFGFDLIEEMGVGSGWEIAYIVFLALWLLLFLGLEARAWVKRWQHGPELPYSRQETGDYS